MNRNSADWSPSKQALCKLDVLSARWAADHAHSAEWRGAALRLNLMTKDLQATQLHFESDLQVTGVLFKRLCREFGGCAECGSQCSGQPLKDCIVLLS